MRAYCRDSVSFAALRALQVFQKQESHNRKSPYGSVHASRSLGQMAFFNGQEAKYCDGSGSIAEVLGGRRVLGKSVKKPDDLAKLVRKGTTRNFCQSAGRAARCWQ